MGGNEKDAHNKQMQSTLAVVKSTLPPNPSKGKALVKNNGKQASGGSEPGYFGKAKKGSKGKGDAPSPLRPYKIDMTQDEAHPLDTLRVIKFGNIHVPGRTKEKVKRPKIVKVPSLPIPTSQITAGSSALAKKKVET